MKNSHVVLAEFSSSLEEKVLGKESKVLCDICLKIVDNRNLDLTLDNVLGALGCGIGV